MEDNSKRPSAALINREWFEAAGNVLSRDELAWVCLHAVEYVLYGKEVAGKGSPVGMVFAMIKPALDSDVIKYLERCARNAANARSRAERVAASGSESQRVEANTTTTTTTTPTTTTTSTTSLSPVEDLERERWLIFGYFWSTGSKAVKQELDAFWDYYESLGWKNNKGAAIVSKLAAARMWHRQFETGESPAGAPVWWSVMKESPLCDYSLFLDYLGAERDGDKAIVRLRVAEDWVVNFRASCASLLTTLARAWRVTEILLERVR